MLIKLFFEAGLSELCHQLSDLLHSFTLSFHEYVLTVDLICCKLGVELLHVSACFICPPFELLYLDLVLSLLGLERISQLLKFIFILLLDLGDESLKRR